MRILAAAMASGDGGRRMSSDSPPPHSADTSHIRSYADLKSAAVTTTIASRKGAQGRPFELLHTMWGLI